MRARTFFYVCAGLFLLALSWHLGARSAGAQSAHDVYGFATGGPSAQHQYVITSNGDVWYQNTSGSGDHYAGPAQFIGNFWGDQPIPARQESWGQLKSRYR